MVPRPDGVQDEDGSGQDPVPDEEPGDGVGAVGGDGGMGGDENGVVWERVEVDGGVLGNREFGEDEGGDEGIGVVVVGVGVVEEGEVDDEEGGFEGLRVREEEEG